MRERETRDQKIKPNFWKVMLNRNN